MKRLQLLLVLFAAMLGTGCAIHHHGYPGHHGGPSIPEGHMPPPGECRIWYPDRSPGQQPPPGKCEKLQYRVPPGAYLIEG